MACQISLPSTQASCVAMHLWHCKLFSSGMEKRNGIWPKSWFSCEMDTRISITVEEHKELVFPQLDSVACWESLHHPCKLQCYVRCFLPFLISTRLAYCNHSMHGKITFSALFWRWKVCWMGRESWHAIKKLYNLQFLTLKVSYPVIS